MRRFICYALLLSTLVACIDRVELPIRAEDPRLVVEGQITNEAPPYTIRLTYTGRYGGNGGQNPVDQFVQEAQVNVTDDQGRSARFVAMGPGTYQTTDATFRGQVGRAYNLSVVLRNGKRYVTKPERMPAVPVIDSISAQLVKTDNFAIPYAFSYSINTRDVASEKNYYRWTGYGITNRLAKGVPCCLGCLSICFDRCWTTVSSEAVNVYSDEAINGNSIRGRRVLQVPVYSTGPQLAEVQQYGITQANYQFWKLYQQQSARTGSIFDPLPAPVTGNVVNANDPTDLARGYFAVTSVTRRRIRVQDYTAPFFPALSSWVFSQLLPGGDCRATYGPVPVTEPEGW